MQENSEYGIGISSLIQDIKDAFGGDLADFAGRIGSRDGIRFLTTRKRDRSDD